MTMINDNDNNSTIEQQIKTIQSLKGNDRTQLIKAISCKLHEFLKARGYTIVTKDFLKTFFSEIENQRTQNKILKEFVCNLLSNGKIENSYKLQNRIRFMRKDLLTFDYDSYKTIMEKNGFKVNCYKWSYNNEDKHPTRKKMGSYAINNPDENLLSYCDEFETHSNIPRNKQGVYSNTSKSIVKCNSKYKIKAFLIL